MHIVLFRENRAKTTDYSWSQGFVVEQHKENLSKPQWESLAMLVRICRENGSPTSTIVFLSLGKVCRIMMQEPSNSWADDALAWTAHELRSKNFPDFLYFVRHSKFCSMTSHVNLFWTCNLISVAKTRNIRSLNSFCSIIMIKKLHVKNAKLSALLTFKSRPLWCTLGRFVNYKI